jgi:hypothetical protein
MQDTTLCNTAAAEQEDIGVAVQCDGQSWGGGGDR